SKRSSRSTATLRSNNPQRLQSRIRKRARSRLECLRRGQDFAALPARAEFLAVEKPPVGFRHRVEGVIFHDEALFVQERVAFFTEPLKGIDLALTALAFGDQREGVGREARRMRRAGGR